VYNLITMACSKCKQKSKNSQITKMEIESMVKSMEKGVTWFLIVWSFFAVYGICSLVMKFL
jgi:hypothetical protein